MTENMIRENEKTIIHIYIYIYIWLFFKKNLENTENNILLFSKLSVFFNFVFKNYSHKIMPSTLT